MTTTTASTQPATTTTTTPASQFTFRTDPGVPAEELMLIDERLRTARQELGDSGPVNVLVYADLDALLGGYEAYIGRGPALATARDRYARSSAESGAGFILLYLPNLRKSDAQQQQRVLFHEYYHTVQNHLISATRNTQVNNVVPQWLVEGSADFYASKLSEGHGYSNDYTIVRREAVRVSRTANPLATYEDRPDPNSGAPAAAYRLGTLATEYLDTTFGTSKTKTEFWRNLKFDKDWRRVFSATFGVSLEEFYAGFENFRATL